MTWSDPPISKHLPELEGDGQRGLPRCRALVELLDLDKGPGC